ncbi:hypothetical protein O6H91_13G016500 [Diphasiastrum complanatum]|uniref:Uncharacterized protein n=1 Tax=Diphasiastrum complanatum TaxID=34168 RepID=A0ACC2BSG3_DIPCM|nr:hypothetical protein O6H91_13G016500 [Diphasiastrum complanatum]
MRCRDPELPAFASPACSLDYDAMKQVQQLRKALDSLDSWLCPPATLSTYSGLLRHCCQLRALAEGKRVHAHIIRSGLSRHLFLGNQLVNMYGRCGSLKDAQTTFNQMLERDTSSWNSLISAYVRHGRDSGAFQLFQQMQKEGVKPDEVTFVCILNAAQTLVQGKHVHAFVTESGCESNIKVATALLKMYAKCGSLEDAIEIFQKMEHKDLVCWTSMIVAYCQNDNGGMALKLFKEMLQEGVEPDEITFVSVLNACTSPALLAQGKMIHTRIMKSNLGSDVALGTALVNMYGKCGSWEDALAIFKNMPNRDVISWTAMITAYTQNGHGKAAVQLFEQMLQEGLKPNKVTFVTIFDACANSAFLEEGRLIHARIADSEEESDVVVGTAILNMYSKCGNLEDAQKMFNRISERDVVLWNSIINTYCQHGHGRVALQLFGLMQYAGTTPNSVTFLSILSACSHSGFVDEGCHYFSSEKAYHGMTLTDHHYSCLIDLLSRGGLLDEAEDFLSTAPFQPSPAIWMTLLGACRIYGDFERGKRIAEQLLQLSSQDPAAYVALSNMYAAAGRWDDVANVRKLMADRHLKKQRGSTTIEINKMLHEFAGNELQKQERLVQ